MGIFDFWKSKRNVKDIIKDINELLPAELEREKDLLNRLKELVIFFGTEKQKEIEAILSSGKEFFDGTNLPPNLQIKFRTATSYFFYRDFLKDKDLKKFVEELNNFKANEDLQLKAQDIEIIKSGLEYDVAKARILNEYFKEIDFKLKIVSIPLKLLKRRGIKLRELYIELLEYLKASDNRREIRRFKKADIENLARAVSRKIEEFSYLSRIVTLIDEQRVLTRKARHMSFNYRNDVALQYIEQIKKLVAEILSDENRRLLGIITFEEEIYIEAERNGSLPSLMDLNSMKIDNSKLFLRRNKLKILAKVAIGTVIFWQSIGGPAVIFALSNTTLLAPYVNTKIEQTSHAERQDIQIPTDFGNLPGWFFNTNNSDKVVLVSHPLGHNKTWEGPLVKKLTDQGYNVVTFDFPGHGEKRDKTFGAISYGANESIIVLQVLKYLENQGFKEIILVGQSMGAVSSIKAAAHYNGSMEIKGIAADAAYANAKGAFHNVGRNVLLIPDLMNDFATYFGGLTSGVNFDKFNITQDAEKIKAPMLFQWGENDNLLPKSVITPLIKIAQKKGDDIRIYDGTKAEGGGHTDLYYKNPARSNDVVNFVLQHMKPA